MFYCSKRWLRGIVFLLVIGAAAIAHAQSAAELLEKARAEARETEELKKALTGPDQSMRLAVFAAMVATGDPARREIALDVGLSSTDSLLQSLALREAVLGMDRIVFMLEVDTSQDTSIQEVANGYLSDKGNTYTLVTNVKQAEENAFGTRGNSGNHGEINGTTVTFDYGKDSGVLQLAEGNKLEGVLRAYHRGKYGQFQASAVIR